MHNDGEESIGDRAETIRPPIIVSSFLVQSIRNRGQCMSRDSNDTMTTIVLSIADQTRISTRPRRPSVQSRQLAHPVPILSPVQTHIDTTHPHIGAIPQRPLLCVVI